MEPKLAECLLMISLDADGLQPGHVSARLLAIPTELDDIKADILAFADTDEPIVAWHIGLMP
jgi:hypothetical protein